MPPVSSPSLTVSAGVKQPLVFFCNFRIPRGKTIRPAIRQG
ncbi:hypothetical protein D083_0877 [Dickeya solani RNS 08.23.3.1.A]|nr:hypothetical protein D083_0877 [Dickeya solani RNS 08.23.3.1.A]